jgi:hypothetical protein
VAVLFEPLDERPAARLPSTQVLGRIERGAPNAFPGPQEGRPEPRLPRRPIRAAAPPASGTPAWLIAVILLVAAVVAWYFLTSS